MKNYTDIFAALSRAVEADRELDDLIRAFYEGKEDVTETNVALVATKVHMELKAAKKGCEERISEVEAVAEGIQAVQRRAA